MVGPPTAARASAQINIWQVSPAEHVWGVTTQPTTRRDRLRVYVSVSDLDPEAAWREARRVLSVCETILGDERRSELPAWPLPRFALVQPPEDDRPVGAVTCISEFEALVFGRAR